MRGNQLEMTKTVPYQSLDSSSNRQVPDTVYSVCEWIRCPNHFTCQNQGLALFHIMGGTCTRSCAFCKTPRRELLPLNPEEPQNIAREVHRRRLKYVVLTSFCRDDLADGGAAHIAKSVNLIHEKNPDTTVEIFVHGCPTNNDAIETIIGCTPEIITHSVMTVPRLNSQLFEKSNYTVSVDFLEQVKSRNPEIVTKSGIILGLGENEYEVIGVLDDLHDAGCNCITLGQYLPRTADHLQPTRSVSLKEFREYHRLSVEMGYNAVRSGPSVCSSFDAAEMYKEIAE